MKTGACFTGRLCWFDPSLSSSRILFLLYLLSNALLLPAWGQEEEALVLRPPSLETTRALERVRLQSLEPVEASWELSTGKARSLEGRFPLEGAATLAEKCLKFIEREPALFGWSPRMELRLASETSEVGVAHLRFATHVLGIPVTGGEVAFHVVLAPGQDLPPSLTHLRARLFPRIGSLQEKELQDLLTPRLSRDEALRIAESRASPSRSFRGESTARLELYALTLPPRLVYAVTVPALAPRGLFLVRVDAHTEQILSTDDLLWYAPPGSRDGTGKVFAVNPIVALQDKTLTDMDDSAGAVPEKAYTRVVLPQLDGQGGLTGPYVTTERTPRAVRRVSLDFSFSRDADAFEEVMLYFHIDSVQRYVQSLGFQNIYKRQLPVYANSEPPGVPYTDLQAYYQPGDQPLGTGILAFGSGGVDLAEDPEVIVHEYGHAMEDSQVPGFGSTFESSETFALGEGWADYLSAAYLAAFSGGYGDVCMGEWVATGLPVFPGEDPVECFRRLDSTKHYPEDLSGEPHADGEMWSASLWRILEALGRDAALKLVFKSNFHLGIAATFEDAAKAVLLADRELGGEDHQDFIQRVFVERGLLAQQLDLTWFYLAKQAPAARIPGGGGILSSKLRIERPGDITPDKTLGVYVNLTGPLADVTLSLRSPSGTTVLLNEASTRFLPSRPVIFGRTLEPEGDLQKLGGEPVSGVWTLQALNLSPEDARLLEWGLRFEGFLRGDANRDGAVNISDAITILSYLFRQGEISCPKAADVDDGGSVNVKDVVGLLFYTVGLGPPPPEPFPDAGEDLTPDPLPCGA
jgi:subtilisin-like proprotein convertase family protein